MCIRDRERDAFFADTNDEVDESGFGEALLQDEPAPEVEATPERFVSEQETEDPQEVEEAIAAFEDATAPQTLQEAEPSYYDEPAVARAPEPAPQPPQQSEPELAASATAPVGAGQAMLEFGHAASPGRFQNADPTLSDDGDENLDIPTFLRKRMGK